MSKFVEHKLAVRDIRLRERASQAVFTRYLNVTTGLVSKWNRGKNGRAAHHSN